MDVGQLRELLDAYPDTMKIAIRGNDGGFTDITFLDEMTLVLHFNQEGTARGEHEDYDFVEVLHEDKLEEYTTEDYLVLK